MDRKAKKARCGDGLDGTQHPVISLCRIALIKHLFIMNV
jgi:hypothetical protein